MKGRWPGPRPSRETLATPGTMVSPGEGGGHDADRGAGRLHRTSLVNMTRRCAQKSCRAVGPTGNRLGLPRGG